MALTLIEQTGASVATPATDEDAIYFDSADDTLKFKDDAGNVHKVTSASTEAVAALTPAADKVAYFTSTTAAALTDLTATARSLLDDASTAAMLVTLGAAPLAAPTFTGDAKCVTASYGDNDTSVATTAFVQAALATQVDDGNSGTTKTIDWTTGNIHKLTLTGNCTLTFTAPSPALGVLIFKVVQGSGPYALTWPAAVHWPSGTAPTLTATNAKIDVFTFYYDGSVYYGSTAGQAYA